MRSLYARLPKMTSGGRGSVFERIKAAFIKETQPTCTDVGKYKPNPVKLKHYLYFFRSNRTRPKMKSSGRTASDPIYLSISITHLNPIPNINIPQPGTGRLLKRRHPTPKIIPDIWYILIDTRQTLCHATTKEIASQGTGSWFRVEFVGFAAHVCAPHSLHKTVSKNSDIQSRALWRNLKWRCGLLQCSIYSK